MACARQSAKTKFLILSIVMALHMIVGEVVMPLVANQLVQQQYMKTLTVKLVKAVVLENVLIGHLYCVILNMIV